MPHDDHRLRRPTMPASMPAPMLAVLLVLGLLAAACSGSDAATTESAGGLADSRPVCDQEPNPGAAPLRDDAPDSVVFYVEDDGWQYQAWDRDLPEALRAETFESAAAVACFAVLEELDTQECTFEEDEGTFTLEVKGAEYQMALFEGATGNLLTTARVTAEPGECPSVAFFTSDREAEWASPVPQVVDLLERELGAAATTPASAGATAGEGACAFVDPDALEPRLGGTPTTSAGPDGACTLTLDGVDIATVTVTDFDQAAYDAGVAELADASNIGNAGVEGKLNDERAVARVGEHLVTAELLAGDRGLQFWMDVIFDGVSGA